MRILITGGAGFIGSHLAGQLLDNGHKVKIVDNLATGSIDNIAYLKSNSRFRYYLSSVLNKPLMLKLVNSSDLIYHLAAAVGVELIIKDPVWTIETNIRGTDIVLDLAQKKKKRVIIASTSEVYGKSPKAKFQEDDDLILGPTTKSRWSYAASKIIDEFLAIAYYKQKKVPATVVRLFNTVGPRQTGRYGMVVPRFIGQALKNKPITVYGNGKQIRTFIHVHDVVEALVKIGFNKKTYGQIYNLGGVESISILNLARKVKNLLNASSKIKFIPYEKAYEKGFEDMARRFPDTSKLKKLISWKAKRTLDDIIKDTAQYELNK